MAFFEIDKEFDDLVSAINKMLKEKGKQIESGNHSSGWDVKKVDEPGLKGYIIEGRFYSDQPIKDLKPFDWSNPKPIRRPLPQRPDRIVENSNEIHEPLTDVFKEEQAVKIYVELPGQAKDDIQLNITDGKVEVTAKNFHKVVDVPGNLEQEQASAKYNNGVLIVNIPKKEQLPEENKQKIRIE